MLENVEEKLAKLLESNVRSTTVQRSYTEEERKIREAILAQYSQVWGVIVRVPNGVFTSIILKCTFKSSRPIRIFYTVYLCLKVMYMCKQSMLNE